MLPSTPPGLTSPVQARALYRSGLAARTAGWALGHAQAHLVALPSAWAPDMSLFCARNSGSCPVLDICDAGAWTTRLAAEADLRTDLPRYRVWEDGQIVAEPREVRDHWHGGLVTFLLGRDRSLDTQLASAGVPLRHMEQERPLPLYVTNRSSCPAGRLNGPLVVAMRPIPAALVATARAVSRTGTGARLGQGAPVHAGDPGALGIRALSRPDFGGRVRPAPGDVPVFWASSLTVQAALMSARPPFALTHAPGHMLITDLPR
ncbi:DUF1445 domain-containing protein [Streptomyces sp. NBC_01795]|uniref:D-glutamate cyclase family protein n=1 Tax=unclassified Streptomyces TaxID=2593676 RepID=UPI002DDA3A7F|nr:MULTISPECIES: DUF1445 domain-containing protein [unclassified Streptomyces]WSA96526.1 DUF1445 domain-containing protein [Streptomyces sp. NBC_01795]WSS10850.1 DUF1445 domain-containing protein [Streptomyces sp. NBC_01186]